MMDYSSERENANRSRKGHIGILLLTTMDDGDVGTNTLGDEQQQLTGTSLQGVERRGVSPLVCKICDLLSTASSLHSQQHDEQLCNNSFQRANVVDNPDDGRWTAAGPVTTRTTTSRGGNLDDRLDIKYNG